MVLVVKHPLTAGAEDVVTLFGIEVDVVGTDDFVGFAQYVIDTGFEFQRW